MDYVDVQLQASPALTGILAVVHGAATIGVLATPMPWWMRIAGCMVLLTSAFSLMLRQALLRLPGSIMRVRLMQDGTCQLHTREHGVIDGTLQPVWIVSPLLIVLRIACPGERLSRGITLLPDSSDADTLRRLRIFLRFALDSSVGKQ